MQKANLNAFAYLLEYMVRFGVGLALTPLILSGLGDFYFGVWQLLNKLTNYLLVASGNPTQALKWSLASKQNSTDYLQKRQFVGSSLITWLAFFPFLGLAGAALAWYMPFILKLPIESYFSVRVATGILVCNLILFNLADIPNAILRGENLGYTRMGVSALLALLGGLFVAISLYFELGLIGIAAATASATILNGCLFYFIVREHVDWFGIARPALSEVKKYAKLSGWYMLWFFVTQMSTSGDVILLGIFSTPELVTKYTITKYIPQLVITLVFVFVAAVTPGLGGIIGQNQLDKARSIRAELMTMSWLVVTISGALFLLCNQSFVSMWIGEEYYAGNLPMLLIVIMITQYVLYNNDANIIDLFLVARAKTVLGFIALLLSTIGAYILVKTFSFGIIGLCFSFIAGHLILTIGLPILVGRYLKTDYTFVSNEIYRQIGVMVVLFGVSFWCSTQFQFTTAWHLLGAATLGLAIFGTVAIGIGLSTQQRALLFMRVQRLSP